MYQVKLEVKKDGNSLDMTKRAPMLSAEILDVPCSAWFPLADRTALPFMVNTNRMVPSLFALSAAKILNYSPQPILA